MIRGVVFDLDGTLVDSRLDFAQMRQEMGLPSDHPILEAIERLNAEDAARCQAILHRHEWEGAERATLLDGVAPLLETLAGRGMRLAIATRNSREITAATLTRVGLTLELVLTRDDGPVKPDPWPILHACRQWNFPPHEVVIVGDFRFDIECGRAAGSRTVLLSESAFLNESWHGPAADSHGADLVLRSLADYPRLLAWLET